MANIAIGDKIESPVVYVDSLDALNTMKTKGTISGNCIYAWPTYGASTEDYRYGIYDTSKKTIKYIGNDGLEYKNVSGQNKGLLPKLPGADKYFSGNGWTNTVTTFTKPIEAKSGNVSNVVINQWDGYSFYGGLLKLIKYNITFKVNANVSWCYLAYGSYKEYQEFTSSHIPSMGYINVVNRSVSVMFADGQLYLYPERGLGAGTYTVSGTLVASNFLNT